MGASWVSQGPGSCLIVPEPNYCLPMGFPSTIVKNLESSGSEFKSCLFHILSVGLGESSKLLSFSCFPMTLSAGVVPLQGCQA